jgi:hypothetical protein
MTDTVQVPGAGPVHKKLLVAGGGGAAVFILWRYQKATKAAKAKAAADAKAVVSVDPATGLPLDPVTGLPYDPSTGLVMTPGGSLADQFSGVPPGPGTPNYTGPVIPQNNLQWTQDATKYLVATGYDAMAVAAALGAYLNRATLSPAQVVIVQAATAALGPPPFGGPYASVPTPTPVPLPSPLVAPTGLHVTGHGPHHLTVGWTAAAGAVTYHLGFTSHAGTSGNASSTATHATLTGLHPRTTYTITLTAVDAAGHRSAPATTTGTTPAATSRNR